MKKRRTMLTVVIAVFALTLCAGNAQDATDKGKQVAETWLALVDGGDYAASWDNASSFFRKAVSKEDWKKSLDSFRPPFGKVIQRTLKSSEYTTSMPGAPDGEYVLIQFDTSFERKKQAIETIAVMLDNDGDWKVSGYFIK